MNNIVDSQLSTEQLDKLLKQLHPTTDEQSYREDYERIEEFVLCNKRPLQQPKSIEVDKNEHFINSSFVMGLICVVFLMIEIIFFFYALYNGIFAFGFGDVIIVSAWYYAIKKTLWNKKRLTNLEWLICSITIIWFILAFLYGFIIGILSTI